MKLPLVGLTTLELRLVLLLPARREPQVQLEQLVLPEQPAQLPTMLHTSMSALLRALGSAVQSQLGNIRGNLNASLLSFTHSQHSYPFTPGSGRLLLGLLQRSYPYLQDIRPDERCQWLQRGDHHRQDLGRERSDGCHRVQDHHHT